MGDNELARNLPPPTQGSAPTRTNSPQKKACREKGGTERENKGQKATRASYQSTPPSADPSGEQLLRFGAVAQRDVAPHADEVIIGWEGRMNGSGKKGRRERWKEEGERGRGHTEDYAPSALRARRRPAVRIEAKERKEIQLSSEIAQGNISKQKKRGTSLQEIGSRLGRSRASIMTRIFSDERREYISRMTRKSAVKTKEYGLGTKKYGIETKEWMEQEKDKRRKVKEPTHASIRLDEHLRRCNTAGHWTCADVRTMYSCAAPHKREPTQSTKTGGLTERDGNPPIHPSTISSYAFRTRSVRAVTRGEPDAVQGQRVCVKKRREHKSEKSGRVKEGGRRRVSEHGLGSERERSITIMERRGGVRVVPGRGVKDEGGWKGASGIREEKPWQQNMETDARTSVLGNTGNEGGCGIGGGGGEYVARRNESSGTRIARAGGRMGMATRAEMQVDGELTRRSVRVRAYGTANAPTNTPTPLFANGGNNVGPRPTGRAAFTVALVLADVLVTTSRGGTGLLHEGLGGGDLGGAGGEAGEEGGSGVNFLFFEEGKTPYLDLETMPFVKQSLLVCIFRLRHPKSTSAERAVLSA
ncbi:hypothetical protein B0H13DRAFT_1877363 [Mycena leptocephala]|nr:hypothetical protein B0H13DRAFT_1877363 [Mycena leptocephala]